jgi:retron-type reverse transcriptase
VLDLDIKGFFDSIQWELMLKAVRYHTDSCWVALYIKRWLKALVRVKVPRRLDRHSLVRHLPR